MTTEELLPCPFCGGVARRVDFNDLPETDPNVGGSLIECTRCQAGSAVHFDRKENLIDSWNSRSATATQAGGEVERMRRALGDLHTAAKLVSLYGATTGPQWVNLTAAMVRAHKALGEPRHE